ncbi:MAG: hypothetical protein RI909_374, partial [Bacteroidota bacterium]
MAIELITTCPVCDHQKFSPYIITKDYTVTGEEFTLQKCSHCHFILTNPRPGQSSIGRYYESENYISHSGKSKTLFDKVYLTARNITLGWKKDLIKKYSPTPSAILDYGCGTGNFLNYIKASGWQVKGIEPNQGAREKAGQLIGDNVYPAIKALKGETFQMITLWHVLEHIHDLNSTIQELKKHLTAEGHLIIAVPNPNSTDSLHYKNHWAGYDVPRHLWHLTRNTMEKLMVKNGLRIVAVSPMKLDSYYVSLLSEGYKNPSKSKLAIGLRAFMQGLLSNLSARK